MAPNGFDPNSVQEDDSDLQQKVERFRMAVLSGEDPSIYEGANDLTVKQGAGYADDDTFGGRLFFSKHKTVAQLLNELGTWNSDQVEKLQQQLYQAGYFDARYYNDPDDNPVQWGSRFDNGTRRAYAMLLADGATYGDLNLEDILSDRAKDFERSGQLANGKTAKRAAIVGGGNVYETTLSDPAETRELADQVATAILGRKVSPEEKERYAHLINAEERTQQAKGHSARETAAQKEFGARVAAGDASINGENAERALAGGASGDQISNAQVIINVGRERGESEQTIAAALATALMESGLRNLPGGDADSVGLFQQRPSQGWGTPQQINDPTYAAGKFFDAYARSSGDSVNERIANTQRPAAQHRGKYANHFGQAAAIYAQLTGGNADLGGAVSAGNGTAYSEDTYIAPTFVESTSINSRARLNEQIRADNPDEAGAHDIALQYEQFRSLIGARRNV